MSSVLLVVFSGIDIRISSLFFDNGFYMANQGWARLPHEGLSELIVISIVAVVGIYVFNRIAKKNVCRMDGKKLAYLLLVLILGAGLIVNVILKDNFGRARPRDIEEFGGTEHFTPAYVVAHACDRNCSFSSGDSAGAFFSLAFIFAVSRKRAIVAVAIGFGVLVSVGRIASGAHFLSDTVVSFFVMLIVSDVLYYHMFLARPAPIKLAPAARPGLLNPADAKPSTSL